MPISRWERGSGTIEKNQLEFIFASEYNADIKVERLLPPRERLPIVAAPPRLEAMTTRLAEWVAFKSETPSLSGTSIGHVEGFRVVLSVAPYACTRVITRAKLEVIQLLS